MATTNETAETPKPKGPTLHHLNNSQSQRILWLCEELSIAYNFEYTLVNHYRNKKTHRAPPELESIHQLGKSPILVTADGTALVESCAIAAYLLKTYDTSNKFGTEDWLRDETLVSFAGTSLGNVTMIELLVDIAAKQTPWPLSYITKAIRRGLQKTFTTAEFKKAFTYLEKELGDNEWFNGKELGRSDFIMSWPFDNIAQRGWFDFKEYPKIAAWRQRIQSRDAWKRALEKGNGYDLTLA